jgi:hypothetical protein
LQSEERHGLMEGYATAIKPCAEGFDKSPCPSVRRRSDLAIVTLPYPFPTPTIEWQAYKLRECARACACTFEVRSIRGLTVGHHVCKVVSLVVTHAVVLYFYFAKVCGKGCCNACLECLWDRGDYFSMSGAHRRRSVGGPGGGVLTVPRALTSTSTRWALANL